MIETNRLILRKFENKFTDIKSLYEILADKEVNKYLPWWPAKSIGEGQSFYDERIANSRFFYAICQKNNIPIGYIDISDSDAYDLGYGLKQNYWNQGITTEAGLALIEHVKDKDIPYLTATCDRENIGSGRVMQKLGMNYQYSYQEQWQPKDLSVIFQMYQINLQVQSNFVYRGYWDRFEKHFIEDIN